MSSIFGPVRQTAYLVDDIEAAMEHWINVLGVGPFFYLRDHAAESFFRGAPTDMRISLAFAQSGALQIELVQQLNDAPSLFTESRAAGRLGLHHLAFWTRAFDTDLARHVAAGYQVVQRAGLNGPGNRNAFLEKPGALTGRIGIEISEISGSKGAMFERIAAAAQDWDGRDPIRML